MRGLVGMLPWVVVLAIAGAAVWLVLDRHEALGAWVLAGLLVAHGLIHALFLVPAPEPAAGADGRHRPAWPFDVDRSWLIALAGARRGRTIAALLIAAIVVLSLLAALATVGVLAAGWWPGLVTAAAVASLALLLAAFDIQLVLGIAIDAALLLVVLTGAWRP